MAGARVSSIETLLHDDYPNLVHVRVHSDDGLTGLGETFFHREAVSEFVHWSIAPLMLGESASNVAAMWQRIGVHSDGRQAYAGTTSVSSSATSAFDMAMWDLRAKTLGLPLHEALGGAVRDKIRLYNTCADAGHRPPAGTPRQEWHLHETWGLGGPQESRYADWTASVERPGELAKDLVREGWTAMKIFPFMRLGRMTRGLYITQGQLEENLEPFRAIRQAVGRDIDLCVDLANMWTLGPALQICAALEEFDLFWVEDVLRHSSIEAMAQLAGVVRTPIAGQDFRAGLQSYADMINAGGVAIVRMDLQWGGGVTEAVRIAGYANARSLGMVLHDGSGPVNWATAVHTCLHLPNAMILEAVRAYIADVYPTILEAVPEVVAGHALPLPGPGHGAELSSTYLEGTRRRTSTIRNGTFVTA